MQRLHDVVVGPLAAQHMCGVWCRQWRRVSLGGSTQDMADMAAIKEAFERQAASFGRSACPALRLVSSVDGGTHVLFGMCPGASAERGLGPADGRTKAAGRHTPPGGPESFGCETWNMDWSS